jgi:hypothetical protein
MASRCLLIYPTLHYSKLYHTTHYPTHTTTIYHALLYTTYTTPLHTTLHTTPFTTHHNYSLSFVIHNKMLHYTHHPILPTTLS